jgi:hypothetical protein
METLLLQGFSFGNFIVDQNGQIKKSLESMPKKFSGNYLPGELYLNRENGKYKARPFKSLCLFCVLIIT